MKKINMHGLKIRGLKKASGDTVNWNPRSSVHDDIFFNRSTGAVWTVSHIGESWSEYNDPDVIFIMSTTEHKTMQQIANAIWDVVSFLDAITF